MESVEPYENRPGAPPGALGGGGPSPWTARYGDKHRWVRLTQFPADIIPPRKVRVYRRAAHYLLQWWDPAAGKSLSDRVDGDLLAALARAREVDERLAAQRSSGPVRPRLGHGELVDHYLRDLGRRADAGEVAPATVGRYAAALAHYRAYCDLPDVGRAYPHAARVNRDFRLAFAAFLAGRGVAANGRGRGPRRPMRGGAFVLGAVRALYAWAADPGRGNLLPEGFRNVFARAPGARDVLLGDPLAEPDITLPMALDLVAACDCWQLRLFAPMLVFGLRAAEPCFLFAEYLQGGWLQVPCNPDLDVRTKGRRSKRLPLVEDLGPLWELVRGDGAAGLLYVRRPGGKPPPLAGRTLAELVEEYRRRGAATSAAADRLRVRDGVLRDAGGLTYDQVEGEFRGLARGLGWPTTATLKDLRHLFATAMNNAALPEGFRRYLLGQAPGRAAAVAYTHLHELPRQFAEAIRRVWSPLLEAINRRTAEVGGRRG